MRIFRHIVCLLFLSSCANQTGNVIKDDNNISELKTASSKDALKFDCLTNNNIDSCKEWFKSQKKINYTEQPFILVERLCPEVDVKACMYWASKEDVNIEEKIKLLGFGCASKNKTACKKKETLENQLNVEVEKKKNQERLEKERIAKEQKIEEERRLAEEIAEKKRIELEQRRKELVDKLEIKCNEKKAEQCLKLATILEKGDSEKAFQYFKNACEYGHIQTCKLISKIALKNNDTDLAIFAYSVLCEKEYKNSCTTLIELRRMKSEQDDRREMMAYQVRQAEESKLERIREQEAQAEANRRAAAIQLINGIQKSFQPKPVVRCKSRKSFMGVDTVCEESAF